MKHSMSKNQEIPDKVKVISGGVTAPAGFVAGGIACGLKGSGKMDLAALISESENNFVSAAFTCSKVAAAPILYDMDILKNNRDCRAIIINSGCANACTGDEGIADVLKTVNFAAEEMKIPPEKILVASTGVIGQRLQLNKIENGLKTLKDSLARDGGSEAAQAIMTTDSFNKELAIEVELSSGKGVIGGMAKGAGMIAPKVLPMATMLAFITTDIEIPEDDLILDEAVTSSFNKITVDGDTSTNDSVFLISNGQSGIKLLNEEDVDVFNKALSFICLELAKMIVLDGEGATKLIHYKIKGAASDLEAESMSRSIANSLLVKTAFFGQDPNWGRILAAAGRCEMVFDLEKAKLWYGPVKVVENGIAIEYDQESLKKIMADREISVTLDLNIGPGQADFYGCDLSYDYVKLNAEYHT